MESPDDSSSSSSCPSWDRHKVGGLGSAWDFRSHALPRLPLVISQFHEAAYSRRPDVLRLFLSKVTSPEHRNLLLNSPDPQTNNTPFLWACMTGCVEAMAVVLEAGANICCVNVEGKNGLHLAVASGVVDSVSYLLSVQGFLSHNGDCEGATPVHYAAVASSEMVKAFVDVGVSFLVQDVDGDTPLHWSIRESLIENVVLMYGTSHALKEVSNSEGETPFQLALLYEEEEICHIFGGKSAAMEAEKQIEQQQQQRSSLFVEKKDAFGVGLDSVGSWGVSKLETRSSNLFGFGSAQNFASVN